MEAYSLNEGIIITLNESGEEMIEGRRVRILPVYEWLEG
jgi:hypothetical protein